MSVELDVLAFLTVLSNKLKNSVFYKILCDKANSNYKVMATLLINPSLYIICFLHNLTSLNLSHNFGVSLRLYIFNFWNSSSTMPIAVAAQSKARNVFARSNTEIVGSNPT
jgi:hypothetical protein